jgi:hypothetical protein
LQALRLIGIGAQRLAGVEMPVTFDAQPARPYDFRQFKNPRRAKFGKAHAEVAEAKGNVRVFGIKLSQKPRRPTPWAEQLDHRLKILGLAIGRGKAGIERAIGAHLLFLFGSQKFHRNLSLAFGCSCCCNPGLAESAG